MSSLLYILSSLTHYQKESDKNSRNKTVWVCHPYPSIKKVFEGLELAKKWQYVDFCVCGWCVAMCVSELVPVGTVPVWLLVAGCMSVNNSECLRLLQAN